MCLLLKIVKYRKVKKIRKIIYNVIIRKLEFLMFGVI